MSLRKIELRHVALPLKMKIKHASREREISDNLIVAATLDSGETGYGEGVPRSYVTGETIETAFATLRSFDFSKHMGRPATFLDVIRKLESLELPETANDPRGMAGNSARCAFELAILDAYGHKFGLSLGDAATLVKADPVKRRLAATDVRYSGAITSASPRKERISAWKARIYGFHQVKVKVGVTGQDDPKRLKKIRKILGSKIDIRIDANEAWKADELVDRVKQLKPFGISAIEQPIAHAEVARLAELRAHLGIPVMLDESLCGLPDAKRAVEQGLADILNVRLSKCGGLIGSLRIMAIAAKAGLDVQLGCHPGESALLSAAGRQLASRIDGIRYLEGSYDKHVLTDNIIKGDITFGYGGWAKPIIGPGLGVKVDTDKLGRLTSFREEIHYV